MASAGKRAYVRLTLFERRAIEEALSKRYGIRQIAEALVRAPSTVANEIKANRTVLRGGERGGPIKALPEKACAKLMRSPGVCNPCKYYHHPCGYKLKVEYLSTRADHLCDARKRQARTGADRSEASMAMALSVIRSDVSRGLSPVQIARARKDELKVSASTVYRWISRGYCGMSDLELRRKVGYKPRRKVVELTPTAHGKDRCYETFVSLGVEQCEGATEMDTVIGTKFDAQCILALYLRPSRFQFMFLLAQKTSSAVAAALDSLERICTADVFQTAFGLVLTDNGSEFSDTKALERSALKDCPRTEVGNVKFLSQIEN